MCTYVRTYICAFVQCDRMGDIGSYMYMHISTVPCVHTYIHTYTHTYIHTYVVVDCDRGHGYVHTYVRMCVCSPYSWH